MIKLYAIPTVAEILNMISMVFPDPAPDPYGFPELVADRSPEGFPSGFI